MSMAEVMGDSLKAIVIQNVSFSDMGVEVAFFETREQTENVALMKSIVFTRAMFAADIEDLMSDIEDLVDSALTALRNPPQKIANPRDRILSGQVTDEDIE